MGMGRSDGMKKWWAELTPEERSAEMSRRRKKGAASMSAEQKSELGRKAAMHRWDNEQAI